MALPITSLNTSHVLWISLTSIVGCTKNMILVFPSSFVIGSIVLEEGQCFEMPFQDKLLNSFLHSLVYSSYLFHQKFDL